jgi:hypothetical protein
MWLMMTGPVLRPLSLADSSPVLAGALQVLGAVLLAALLVWAVRARRRSQGVHFSNVAEAEVCPHLRPAYDLLTSRGHVPVNVGQRHPDLPLEIHMAPPFEPRAVHDELKMAEPVFVSERNVLYCKEDLCEIRPVQR